MLSDELSRKAVSLTLKSTYMTLKVLENALKSYLRNRDISKQGQSLKKLNKQNQELQYITIIAKDIRGFKRELRSYGVDVIDDYLKSGRR